MERRLSNALGILTIISIVLYSLFFSLARKEFLQLFTTYTILFVAFIGLCYVAQQVTRQNLEIAPAILGKWFYKMPLIGALFLIGLILRLVLLQNTPHLSQDFLRFIWDGHQLLNGYNPYLHLPDEVITTGASHIPNAAFLHANMGELSSSNYTNYPPLNQLFFAVASWLGGDSILASVLWMRVFLILADIGVFIYGIKLLKLLGKPLWLIALYYLNPFVIVELTGNLHWEGMMAFFLLLAIYYLLVYKKWQSVLFMGYGILLKLLPVMVLPLLVRKLRFKKAILYYIAVAAVVLMGFTPFISQDLIDKYGASVGLWFGNFEFNGSVYYLVRYVGYEVTGYNIIQTAGKILPLITVLIILILSFKRKNEQPEILLSSIVFAFFTYLLFSTTVHPWYLTIPLLFSVFTRYRFMVIWSFTVFLSYDAYSNVYFEENHLFIAVQYMVVLLVFGWEIFVNNSSTVFKTD
ncbi:glycosyltransferase 87 family protein [Nonlabens sp.]|uniref:glycosyltransferase 87 family protein n=1 Tax=Nonlabens sp. TaxID=1888209 RepID=UPI003F69D356